MSRYDEAGAEPADELLVTASRDGVCAALPCPYCDEVVRLHDQHSCPRCGADLELSWSWSA